MNILPTSTNKAFQKLFVFALLLFCAKIVAGQTTDREANLRSLVAAEQEFSRTSKEKGTREAFITFLADDGVIFNPLPANGKQVWMPREKAPGVLTWTPVFADISGAGDLGFTTGPYEFRRAAGEKPVGYGFYMSVWRKGADGAWKVLLDIGTRNSMLETTPALEFPQVRTNKVKKKINLERERAALKTADDNLSRFLSAEKTVGELKEFTGDYLRVHRTNDFPFVEKNAALAAMQTYQGRIISQTVSTGIAQSGDFGYSYGTYKAKAATEAENNTSAENGSFVRIWRRDEKGKWKLTLVVMHAAPPGKRAGQ
ncbi:MAG: nuclear transport factor 2 family protein [Acidobacteriota bacterium]|nr:nuclear transport factor 2 family protein [Acidobacteriota bacterium]